MLEAAFTRELRDYTLAVELSARAGEIIVLMGENGSGKTTTLHCLSGLLSPDQGFIRLGERMLFHSGTRTNVPAEERQVGYVFQNAAVFPHMTVQENVAFGLRIRGLPRDTVQDRAAEWMDILELRDLEAVRASKLSEGQKQRVALARALAIEPRMLMLDEPFNGLDSASHEIVQLHIRESVYRLRIPCLLVTHRWVDASMLGDRVYSLRQGRISQPGPLPNSFPKFHAYEPRYGGQTSIPWKQ